MKFQQEAEIELQELEKSREVEANTQGSILHESLEMLYKPFIGRVLQSMHLFGAIM